MKSFIKDISRSFQISQDYTRFSSMSYTSFSVLNFPFSEQFATQQDLDSKIDAIPYSRPGSPNTEEALVNVKNQMFNANNGARLSGL